MATGRGIESLRYVLVAPRIFRRAPKRQLVDEQ